MALAKVPNVHAPGLFAYSTQAVSFVIQRAVIRTKAAFHFFVAAQAHVIIANLNLKKNVTGGNAAVLIIHTSQR